jgi:hypothetical protein
MERRTIRRALVGALTALILSTAAAYADTVPADGGGVTPGVVALPDAAPGQVVTWPITFKLTCGGTSHVAPGSTIQIAMDSASVPLDGDASATATSIGPVPANWALDGCPSPAPTLAANGPSVVTLTMPTTAGDGYEFTLFWSRVGATGLTGFSVITFRVNVVANTPPTLHLPADFQAEATSPAGAAVAWSASATDAEDASPPTPTCAPASGSTFPLGPTTVQCSVADGGGLPDSGSFTVTVVDSTAPSLVVPADRSVVTDDPSGTTLSYPPPTATDLVDPAPTVACLPASGTHVAVGTTTVSCTARDTFGNHAEASFTVAVAYVPAAGPAIAWSAMWGEPVATAGSTFVANPGRTVPVKVELLADGVRQTHGSAVLTLATCGGAAVGSMAMSWGGGRWNASLDTGSLGGPGCYTATASLDGNVAGSFRIDLRGADPTATGNGPKATGSGSKATGKK